MAHRHVADTAASCAADWHARCAQGAAGGPPSDTAAPTHPYKHRRFPAEIISHSVWLYYRFCLSYRDIEELPGERGVIVTYEAIRQ